MFQYIAPLKALPIVILFQQSLKALLIIISIIIKKNNNLSTRQSNWGRKTSEKKSRRRDGERCEGEKWAGWEGEERRGGVGMLFLGNRQGSPLQQVTSESLAKGSEIRGHIAPFPAISLVTGSWQWLNKYQLREWTNNRKDICRLNAFSTHTQNISTAVPHRRWSIC